MHVKIRPATVALALMSALALDARADGVPEVSAALKNMLGALPIAGLKGDVQKLVTTLRKTSCGGGLTGCYATKSGPLQLYFFTSGTEQQTFLLVFNQKMALPALLKENIQKMLGGTAVSDPIISISTTSIDLDTVRMPPDLQNIVRDSYFNVNSLTFSDGVQLAARADLGGVMKATLKTFGVKSDQVIIRAGVVMPIPTDLASGAGTGAGMAAALRQGDTMKKATADAAMPEAYVEFQLAPSATVAMWAPRMTLTDATFFINNAQVFGYKGNARFDGVDKTFLLHFQTVMNPAMAMVDPSAALDLLDFSFRMAMPATFTLEDQARIAVGMAIPDVPPGAATMATAALAKLGGGYIGNIKAIVKPLLAVTKPLSVFQLRNPTPAPPYKFGDRTKPFPTTDAPFNVYLLGPLAEGGPFLHVASDVRILGQTMGKMEVTVGKTGFHGQAEETITVKLGPLGKTKIKMLAKADITSDVQSVRLDGDLAGQKLALVLAGDTLSVDFSASCVNPFEIKTKVTIQEGTDIAQILEGQGGVNVDPSKLDKCIGKQLEAALNKITNEYKHLAGYSANEASAALNKLSNDALKALNADAKYRKAKDAARKEASSLQNDAMKAFNDALNGLKGLGKRHKHKKGPDPRFAASVFDWDYYYDKYPDVVKLGGDLATHWRDHGFAEGRQGSREFSAKYYRSRYNDVQERCFSHDYNCVLQLWLDEGIEAGRQGSKEVSVASYLRRYPNLQREFGKEGYADALEHWMNDGSDEGRNAFPEIADDGPMNGPVLAGGDGGTLWTDLDACDGQYVDGFRIRSGSEVNSVRFRYVNHWGETHGAADAGPLDADVTLAPGDYIVRVDFRSGARIDAVTFKTKLGKTYGPYGGGGGTARTFKVIPGEKLGCMSGRSGASVDRLIFSSTGPLR